MIVVTGAKGFIGSNLIAALERDGEQVIAVDWISPLSPEPNLRGRKNIAKVVQPEALMHFLDDSRHGIEAVVHLGAISSTTTTDQGLLATWNVSYSLQVFNQCTRYDIPIVYASSAAVYGNGDGPLSLYAHSKMEIDGLIRASAHFPPRWAGLRFFNVYGPRERHKGGQASMVTQMLGKHEVKLFEGAPTRDFIHVDDCCRAIMAFLDDSDDVVVAGIVDIGTGVSRPFDDIAAILGLKVNHVPMPESLKAQYQFHTRARTGWPGAMTLEDGIDRKSVV